MEYGGMNKRCGKPKSKTSMISMDAIHAQCSNKKREGIR
jgi:hypothetical protein